MTDILFHFGALLFVVAGVLFAYLLVCFTDHRGTQGYQVAGCSGVTMILFGILVLWLGNWPFEWNVVPVCTLVGFLWGGLCMAILYFPVTGFLHANED